MQPKGLYQHEMLSKALLTQLSGVCLSGNCGTSEACAESTHTSLCPASELSSWLWMPTSSSDSAVGTGPRSDNASELDWRTKSSKSTNCRSAPPLARPPAHHEIGPLPSVPEQSPPLTFLLGGTATLHPEQRQHHPGQQHRRGHHGGDFPAWIPVREPTPTGGAACGTAPGAAPLRKEPAESGSRKLRGCWSLCHAPDPPGGDGRRKRGGGGSSSRAAPAPAPARGGEAAGPEPGEGAGSAGAEA